MHLFYLTNIMEIMSRTLIRFEKNLSENLINIRASRMSASVKDVEYRSATIPNRTTQPKALYWVSAMLKTISVDDRRDLRIFNEGNVKRISILEGIQYSTNALCILLNSFKKSCQTAQLINLTATSIMDVLELRIFVSVYLHETHNYICQKELENMNDLLHEILVRKSYLTITSPLCLELIYGFHVRLETLRLMFVENN